MQMRSARERPSRCSAAVGKATAVHDGELERGSEIVVPLIQDRTVLLTGKLWSSNTSLRQGSLQLAHK